VGAEWPDLQPCAGELKPTLEFNPDWLPDAVKPFVIDISERMAVAVDFPAICTLTCLAGAISHRAFVFPLAMDKDFAEPLNISGAVIADSGKKKTPTWKILMNPLIEWECDQDRVYVQRLAEYTKKLQVYQTAKKAVNDYNKEETRLAKKEKRDPILQPYIPGSKWVHGMETTLPSIPKEPERERRLVVNDSTPEEIHEIAKTNPQGLFYYRDELSGWAAELDMTGREGARSMFLQGMTGDHHHTVDRIGRDGGHALVTLSVFGSFQPHLFVNFFSEARCSHRLAGPRPASRYSREC
jgi:putative DNA primase/helicase